MGISAAMIEELTPSECLELLEFHDLGRLAVIAGGFPVVFPVNYTVARDRVLIRTDPGTKLVHSQFERVCFEVDDLDRTTRTGRSVLVKGVIHELQPVDHLDRELQQAEARIQSWTDADLAHVLVITPISITGRRLR